MDKYIYDCVFIDGDNILKDYIKHISDGYVTVKTYFNKYKEIFSYLEKNKGVNPYLDCEYARLLFEGLGCKQDRIKAHQLFLKLAEKNFALAQYHLANSYNCKNGVEPNLQRSSYYYNLAYKNNCLIAAYGIAHYYNKGHASYKKGSPTSMLYYMIAICNGNFLALEKLSYFSGTFDFFDSCDYSLVLDYLDKQIENKNKKAHIAKALFYEKVYLLEEAYAKIINELEQAKEEFYGFGYFKIAYLSLSTYNTSVDLNKHISYIQKAIECHNKLATYNYIFMNAHKSRTTNFIKDIFLKDIAKAKTYVNIYEQKFGLNIDEKYDIGAMFYDIGEIELAKKYIKAAYDICMEAVKDKNYPSRNKATSLVIRDKREGYFAKFYLVTGPNKASLGIKDELCPYCKKKLIKVERKTFFGKKVICQNCKNEIDEKG